MNNRSDGNHQNIRCKNCGRSYDSRMGRYCSPQCARIAERG